MAWVVPGPSIFQTATYDQFPSKWVPQLAALVVDPHLLQQKRVSEANDSDTDSGVDYLEPLNHTNAHTCINHRQGLE